MTGKLAGATIALAVAAALTGCSDTITGPAPSTPHKLPPRERTRVGILIASALDPTQVALAHGLHRRALAIGDAVLGVANAVENQARQADEIAALVAHKARALFIFPVQTGGIATALGAAVRSGVKVVVLGAPAPVKGLLDIQTNNRLLGRQACNALPKLVGRSGTLLIVRSRAARTTGSEVDLGVMGCAVRIHRLTDVSVPVGSNPVAVAASTRDALKAHPDTVAILIEDDITAGSGVLKALRSAGQAVEAGEPGHLVLVSIGGSPDILAAVRAGTVDRVIVPRLDQYISVGFSVLDTTLSGRRARLRAARPDALGTPTMLLGGYIVSKTGVTRGRKNVSRLGAAYKGLWGNNALS